MIADLLLYRLRSFLLGVTSESMGSSGKPLIVLSMASLKTVDADWTGKHLKLIWFPILALQKIYLYFRGNKWRGDREEDDGNFSLTIKKKVWNMCISYECNYHFTIECVVLIEVNSVSYTIVARESGCSAISVGLLLWSVIPTFNTYIISEDLGLIFRQSGL